MSKSFIKKLYLIGMLLIIGFSVHGQDSGSIRIGVNDGDRFDFVVEMYRSSWGDVGIGVNGPELAMEGDEFTLLIIDTMPELIASRGDIEYYSLSVDVEFKNETNYYLLILGPSFDLNTWIISIDNMKESFQNYIDRLNDRINEYSWLSGRYSLINTPTQIGLIGSEVDWTYESSNTYYNTEYIWDKSSGVLLYAYESVVKNSQYFPIDTEKLLRRKEYSHSPPIRPIPTTTSTSVSIDQTTTPISDTSSKTPTKIIPDEFSEISTLLSYEETNRKPSALPGFQLQLVILFLTSKVLIIRIRRYQK